AVASGVFILASAPKPLPGDGASKAETHAPANLLGTLRDHRRTLLTAGSIVLFVQFVRQARQLLIPLWGDEIGLDVAAIGLVFGLSSAIDMTLFYPVGI